MPHFSSIKNVYNVNCDLDMGIKRYSYNFNIKSNILSSSYVTHMTNTSMYKAKLHTLFRLKIINKMLLFMNKVIRYIIRRTYKNINMARNIVTDKFISEYKRKIKKNVE